MFCSDILRILKPNNVGSDDVIHALQSHTSALTRTSSSCPSAHPPSLRAFTPLYMDLCLVFAPATTLTLVRLFPSSCSCTQGMSLGETTTTIVCIHGNLLSKKKLQLLMYQNFTYIDIHKMTLTVCTNLYDTYILIISKKVYNFMVLLHNNSQQF